MTTKLGDLGALVELRIVRGASFGPVGLRFPDTFSLAGCTVSGGIKKLPTDTGYLKAFSIDASQQANRLISLSLSSEDTAALAVGPTVDDVAGLHHAVIELTDSLGRKTRLAYGPAKVAP